MKINKEKSNGVHFRQHRKPRTNFVFYFKDNDFIIVSEYKYLWIILDEHMTFEKAVDTLCGSACRSIYDLLLTSIHLNIGFSTLNKL